MVPSCGPTGRMAASKTDGDAEGHGAPQIEAVCRMRVQNFVNYWESFDRPCGTKKPQTT